MNAKQHLWALQYASIQAATKDLVMLILGRPVCTRRAAWVVEFDRQMELSRRALAAVRH